MDSSARPWRPTSSRAVSRMRLRTVGGGWRPSSPSRCCWLPNSRYRVARETPARVASSSIDRPASPSWSLGGVRGCGEGRQDLLLGDGRRGHETRLDEMYCRVEYLTMLEVTTSQP